MDKKYKIIIAACMVIILGNIYAKFAVLDEQIAKITELQKKMSALVSQNAIRMEEKSDPAEKLKLDMEKTIRQIPGVLSFTQLAARVRFLVDRHQLSVDDSLVFRSEQEKIPDLVKYYTQFSVNGSYKRIKGFLSDLQNVPGLLYLDSVKIVRIEEKQSTLKLSLGITLLFKRGKFMKLIGKNMIFFLAVGILILSIVYRLQHPYVQPRVTKLTYTNSGQPPANTKASRTKRPESSPDPGELSGTLKRVKTSPRVYQDLFALYTPAQKGQQETVTVIPEAPPAKGDTNPMGRVRDYITSYRFYGSYKSGDKKAVFLAKDKLVLVAGTGDRIDGKYLIDEIQDDFIRIKSLELKGTIDIPIREFNDD